MRQWKIKKRRKNEELKLKSEITQIEEKINCILWNSKLKKFLLQFDTENNPLRLLKPETQEISIPLEFDFKIRDLRLTKGEDMLLIFDYSKTFTVIDLSNFRKQNNFRLSSKNIDSSVFKQKSCKKIFFNTHNKGLIKINLFSQKFVIMKFKGLNYIIRNKFKISSDEKFFYGILKNKKKYFPASYNAARGFRYRVHLQKFKKFYNTSNTLNKENTVLISGDQNGKLGFTNFRSYKCMSALQLESKEWIYCLESRDKLIFGGTYDGELFIMRDAHPFSLIYYQKINEYILSIGLSDKYFVVGGNYHDSIKIFEIPKYNKDSEDNIRDQE